jgi:hypothetical protein
MFWNLTVKNEMSNYHSQDKDKEVLFQFDCIVQQYCRIIATLIHRKKEISHILYSIGVSDGMFEIQYNI